MSRRSLPAAIALVLSLPCAPAGAADPVLRIVAPWDFGSLEPSRAGYVFTRMQVAKTLLRVDSQGRLLPGLATKWSAAPDGLSWRLALRQANFHDGTVVSA